MADFRTASIAAFPFAISCLPRSVAAKKKNSVFSCLLSASLAVYVDSASEEYFFEKKKMQSNEFGECKLTP